LDSPSSSDAMSPPPGPHYLHTPSKLMEGLFSLEYLSGPSAKPTKAAYGVSLTSVSRTIAMATSNSPLPLRSDGPTVLLHAVAARRPSDELLYAQYHTDGTLSVGCSPLHPTGPIQDPCTRNFPWSLVSSMEPTCMVLSSDARVLCLCTKGGGLVLLPMDALLPAHGRMGGLPWLQGRVDPQRCTRQRRAHLHQHRSRPQSQAPRHPPPHPASHPSGHGQGKKGRAEI